MPPTFAMCRKADEGEDNILITQDMARAIRVLPSCSCTKSFAVKLCPKQYQCMTLIVRTHWMGVIDAFGCD